MCDRQRSTPDCRTLGRILGKVVFKNSQEPAKFLGKTQRYEKKTLFCENERCLDKRTIYIITPILRSVEGRGSKRGTTHLFEGNFISPLCHDTLKLRIDTAYSAH